MIQLHNVTKRYGMFDALHQISINIEPGEVYGIIGASGAGKSTLLRVINLLEAPTSGEVNVNDQNLLKLSPDELREMRKKIGMIFQHFNLVLNKTVYENVLQALKLANYPKSQRKQRVNQCLQFVGLDRYANTYPAKLSGGQKQRVAIARALANEPSILLCDEPTSALDPNTTEEILSVLEAINKEFGVTIVIVSHDMNVIKSICHKVTVLDGGAEYQTLTITPKGITAREVTAQRFVDELIGGEIS